MAQENAQVTSQTQGGSEKRSAEHSHYSDCQGWIETHGSESGDISSRTSGEVRKGRTLAGGILARLIKDAEERLNEARACIQWYQDEEKKQLVRLDELKQLQDISELEEE